MKWARMSRILVREGENTRLLGKLFKAVDQGVLIFGLDTWGTTHHMVRALGCFQHRVDLQITGRHPWKLPDGSWYYPPPPMEEAMQEVGLGEVEAYMPMSDRVFHTLRILRCIIYITTSISHKGFGII